MAEHGCGAKCAKLFILFINFIFVLIGIFLLGFGIFLVVDTKALHNKYFVPFGGSAEEMIIAAGVILIVGLCILFVTIIGFCAAAKEHAGCLTFYSFILILLLILQIAAIIIAGVFYDKIIHGLDDQLLTVVRHQYGVPGNNQSSDFIDFIQTELHCCGITEKGPLDWKESEYRKTYGRNVPDTCCVKNDTTKLDVDSEECLAQAYKNTTDTSRSKYIYIEGCDAKLDRMIKNYVGVLIGVVIGIVIIQIAFITATCLLKKSVTRGYEYV